jgi:hypothetical protein
MAIHLQDYKSLLQKGIEVLDKLVALYTQDDEAENDWTTSCLSDSYNLQRSFSDRLTNPHLTLTTEETSPAMLSIQQYIANHWADYREFPIADSQKRMLLVDLHSKLNDVARGIGHLYNVAGESY